MSLAVNSPASTFDPAHQCRPELERNLLRICSGGVGKSVSLGATEADWRTVTGVFVDRAYVDALEIAQIDSGKAALRYTPHIRCISVCLGVVIVQW